MFRYLYSRPSCLCSVFPCISKGNVITVRQENHFKNAALRSIHSMHGPIVLKELLYFRYFLYNLYMYLFMCFVCIGARTISRQTFGRQTFGRRTFCRQTFGRRTFCRQDISPTRHLADKTFGRQDIWPTFQVFEKNVLK